MQGVVKGTPARGGRDYKGKKRLSAMLERLRGNQESVKREKAQLFINTEIGRR